jgi:hypothetical protein
MSDVENDIQRTERLIVRKLDGEISEDEELQLNRELIRDPEARRLMEEYERIDGLAAAALDAALGDEAFSAHAASMEAPLRVSAGRGYHRGWWLVPGAVAAALLAIMIARFNPLMPSDESRLADHQLPTSQRIPVVGPEHPGGLQQNVNMGPDKVKRDTGREVIGVVGDDGNIYWIEIDRTRTYKRPGAGWAKPISLEQL